MAISSFAAARRVCEQGKWNVTNLALQKILYLAQMVHMGEHDGRRLIDTQFEAWDYGPVDAGLYHKVKFFGDQPIQDIFPPANMEPALRSAIDDACDFLLQKSPGQLVAMTHWKDGAWAKNYRPGVRGLVIPDADIVAEYRQRLAV